MEKLSEKELLHVASLAHLKLDDQEKETYAVNLAAILNDIEKINNVELESDQEIMISSTTNHNEYHEVTDFESIGKEEALKNSKLSDGDYIVVPKVIHD